MSATYDILIFQGVESRGEQKVELMFGNPGSFTTGIQKVSQSFAKLFLTELGSVANDPTMGTDFLSQLRTGFIRDEATLQSSFQAAVLDVKNYMSQNEGTEVPDDETLEEANLLEWDLRRDFLSLKVQLTTAAGESRVYELPVETRVAT